ncbi:MAG: hypothetical protein ACKO9H_09375, partial [Planctomycetota bacterium]
ENKGRLPRDPLRSRAPARGRNTNQKYVCRIRCVAYGSLPTPRRPLDRFVATIFCCPEEKVILKADTVM